MNAEPLAQYIYGIIPARVPETTARDLLSPAQPLPAGGIAFVGHENMAAVVGQSERQDLAGMRKDTLAKLLIEHQKVIELVMRSAPVVVPFRLGTYIRTENEIREILAKGRKLICGIFNEINGKIEMDVTAGWADFASVLKEIGAEDEISASKGALAVGSRAVSVEERIKIGLLIKHSLDRRRSEISRLIFEKLSAASCAQSVHENMDDQMVVNGAFLVETARRPEFERALDALNAHFQEKLRFRCVGPLAPYSFYTLELKKIRWEDVDWARRIIGLGDTATDEEIKAAFFQAARAAHPDLNGRNASASVFGEIEDARRILLEYAGSCRQTADAARVAFSEESVRKNSMLVKVRNDEK